jgi:hypothetical protein
MVDSVIYLMRHADKVKVNHYSSEEKLNVPLSDV